MNYLLKLGKARLHRYLWVKNFARIALSCTVFEIQAFLCFVIFAKNLKIQNFWREKFFLKNWVRYSEAVPHGSKILSKSLYLARDKRIFVFCIFEKNLKIQNGHHFWQVKYLLKLGKACLHRYPVGQIFCQNPTSKFLFYDENGFKKYYILYQYCSTCVPYEPIFPILCFPFFVKNSKIEYDSQF